MQPLALLFFYIIAFGIRGVNLKSVDFIKEKSSTKIVDFFIEMINNKKEVRNDAQIEKARQVWKRKAA